MLLQKRVQAQNLSESAKIRKQKTNVKWVKANPTRVAAKKSRYRGKMYGYVIDGNYSEEDWKSLVASLNECCASCKQKLPLERDHIIPISQGGSNNIDNIQPLCRQCNARKGSQSIDYRQDKETT